MAYQSAVRRIGVDLKSVNYSHGYILHPYYIYDGGDNLLSGSFFPNETNWRGICTTHHINRFYLWCLRAELSPGFGSVASVGNIRPRSYGCI